VLTSHRLLPAPRICTRCGACAAYCPTGAIYDAERYTAEQAPRLGRQCPADVAEETAEQTKAQEAGSGKLPGGYAGKILRVDVGRKTHRVTPLPPSWVEDYIGGRGFVARILYDEVRPGADPLGPENRVIIAAGPLTGVLLPGCGKTHLGAKSPATGGYGDSNMGGHFGPELKYAGYDVLVLEGASPEPVIVVIDDDRVEIRSAGRYWGRGCFEAESRLKEDLGEGFQIALIGPAGENLVKFACVAHDFGRQAGRTGIGAVLGSKKVKAIAVRGSGSIPLADPEAVYAVAREMYRDCFAKPGFREWTPYGTAGVTDWVNEVGAFPTRNFQTSYFPLHKRINGERLRDEIRVTDKGCMGCPIPCGKYSHVKLGDEEVWVEGPEYETIGLIGGNCCLDDIRAVAYANYVCDDLGLDTISGGNVAAFAIECFEKGILTEKEVGRKLAFGDLGDVVFLLKAMAARQGVGDLLAEGVRAASRKLGRGSERFAIHVKGLEWSGYESRYAPAMMLSYATADIGAHHNRSWAITFDVARGRDTLEGKPERVVELQHIRPLFDTLGVCRLQWVEIGFDLEWYEKIFPAITGRRVPWSELLRASERIWNLTRAFSLRHVPGWGRAFDQVPRRFTEEPVPDGPAKGKLITQENLDRMLDRYYELRGWTKDGRPRREKLVELGLADVARDLWGAE
jgi:aldehyde:ferredoxin oxidoreductase